MTHPAVIAGATDSPTAGPKKRASAPGVVIYSAYTRPAAVLAARTAQPDALVKADDVRLLLRTRSTRVCARRRARPTAENLVRHAPCDVLVVR